MEHFEDFIQLTQIEPWRRSELLESGGLANHTKAYSKEVQWTARFFIKQMLENFVLTDHRLVQYVQVRTSLDLAASETLSWKAFGWQLPSAIVSPKDAQGFANMARDDILACADTMIQYMIKHADT